jgi:signal transduction histidine kinase
VEHRPNDSFAALAISIERVLRSDIDAPTIPLQLAGSIDRIMLDEARAGELRLAWMRLLVVAPYTIVTLLALIHRETGEIVTGLIPAALIGVVWLAGAGAIVIALRRGWYRGWLPHITPAAHAAIILAAFAVWWRLDDPRSPVIPEEILGYVVAQCAFLSLSGALRLSRSAARVGTVLGVAVFLLVAAAARMNPLLALAIALAILATGFLASSVTTIIRRMITEEVARSALGHMYQEAEATIDAREQVLKIVSHDLRNPLNTIAMTVALMLNVPATAEQQREHLLRVKRAGERMNRLIQDLLDVAKFEAGRVAIDARAMEVAPLLREAQEMLAPLAAEKSIHLEAVAAEGLPTITADGGRVLQVLSNLAGNAIKFTPKNGRIVLRADPDPRGVRFSVRDTGPGIPEDQLSQIFGRFWQANPADRRGIGLGLTIAKGIIEAHGGRIWCESRVGEGTNFQFTLARELPPNASGSHERRRTLVTGAG